MCDFCLGNGLIVNLPHNVHVCNLCFDNLFCSVCLTHVNIVGPTERFGNDFWCNDCLQDVPELEEPNNWDQPPVGGDIDNLGEGWGEPILQPRPPFDNNFAVNNAEFNPQLVRLLRQQDSVFWDDLHIWRHLDDIYSMDNFWMGAILDQNLIFWN